MTLFAIGDLHLPGGEEKPMDIFGDHWDCLLYTSDAADD